MKTIEILYSFLNNRESTVITKNQSDWLFRQANEEGYNVILGDPEYYIYMKYCHYKISPYKIYKSGFGGSKTKVIPTDKIKITRLYNIRFLNEKLFTQCCEKSSLLFYKQAGEKFKLIANE